MERGPLSGYTSAGHYVPHLNRVVPEGVRVLALPAYDEADVRLLSTLSSSMSVALENARLFDELRAQAAEHEIPLAKDSSTWPSVAGLVQSFGSGAMTSSSKDLGDARCTLAIGTNTTAAHPIIGLQVMRSIRAGEFDDPEILRAANRLLRQVINHHLGGKELKSRKVLLDLHRARMPKTSPPE